jgi:succinoglycan biosynthesis transport protein ExoP
MQLLNAAADQPESLSTQWGESAIPGICRPIVGLDSSFWVQSLVALRSFRERNGQGGAWVRQEFSLPAANRSNRRRLGVFLGTLAVALVTCLGYTWLRPAEYRASARLEITPAIGAVPSESTASSAPESPRPFLTETQILTSRPVLELAATRLERAGQRYPAVDADRVADMQSHLEAVPVPNTNVVELVATGPRPEVLAPMLNTITEAYRDHLAEAYRDSSAASLVQAGEEVKKLEASVAAKRREAEAFRLRHNIVSLEREENQVLAQTRDQSASLSAAIERVAKAEGKLHALTDSASAGNAVVRSKNDPTLANLEQRASVLREQMQELNRDFTPSYLAKDPKAVAMQSRLAEIERQIVVQRDVGQRDAVAEAQEELAGAREAAARLQSQITAGRKEVGQFTARFNEYKSLQDQLNAIETAYQDASKRLAKREATESSRMPTIRVLEAAATPQQPWRPLYWRDTVLSLGASLALAMLTMWLVELFNRSEPQPTVVLVQPQPGTVPYGATPHALRGHGADAIPLEATSPALLPQQPTFPRELGQDEVAALAQASDDDSRLVVLLLVSGISLDEALALRGSDVDLALGVIHVGGESARDVVLPETLRALLGVRAMEHSPALLSAAHDAGIEDVVDVTSDCLRHTYVAFLVRQGIRFADLTRVVGHLPAEVLGAYSALSPRGSRLPREAINVVYPTSPPRQPAG